MDAALRASSMTEDQIDAICRRARDMVASGELLLATWKPCLLATCTPRLLATWTPRVLATWTPSPGRLQRLSLPLDFSRGGALDYSWTLDEVDEQRRRHRERAVRVGMRSLAMFNM